MCVLNLVEKIDYKRLEGRYSIEAERKMGYVLERRNCSLNPKTKRGGEVNVKIF